MAEWVALPSISGGPRGPFRDLWGPGKGVVGGDFGARAGLGGAAAASAGLHKPLPGRCGAAAAQPGSGCCRGCTRCLGLAPPHTPTQHRSGGRQPAQGQSQEIPPPTSNPKPGLSLCAPSPAAGPALGPPGGLPLFPCCTTVTVAASSAIMKGRQCAGERREPGPSW